MDFWFFFLYEILYLCELELALLSVILVRENRFPFELAYTYSFIPLRRISKTMYRRFYTSLKNFSSFSVFYHFNAIKW